MILRDDYQSIVLNAISLFLFDWMKCMEENKKNADREQQAVEYNHQNTSKIDKINNSFSCNLKKKN